MIAAIYQQASVLGRSERNGARFTVELWRKLVDHLAVTFNMESSMRRRIAENRTAKLIGALPFLADCDHPWQTAVTHVAIYYLALHEGTKQFFLHTPEDDGEIETRLHPIMQFSGGDPSVISRGMDLLKLQMVAGYLRDVEKDMERTKYNPVAAGVWQAGELIDRLRACIQAHSHSEMDAIMDVEEAIRSYWSA